MESVPFSRHQENGRCLRSTLLSGNLSWSLIHTTGGTMKTIDSWNDLRPYGIDLLTGESCSLMLRILFDLTAQGQRIVENCLGCKITAEPWNSGTKTNPHTASILLTQEMLQPLAIFALLESCPEVWLLKSNCLVGIEPQDDIEALRRVYAPIRSYRLSSTGSRNQHQMSGRIE